MKRLILRNKVRRNVIPPVQPIITAPSSTIDDSIIHHVAAPSSTIDDSIIHHVASEVTPPVNLLNSTFHVLIATIGRPALINMLNSLKPQLTEADCLTVVYDGRTCPDKSIYDGFKCKVNIFEEPVALGYWGHGIRNKYASLLEPRDFVLHADDDNRYHSSAFVYFRNMIDDKSTLYVAKTVYQDNKKLIVMPSTPIIKVGNIDTGCGIIPFELNKRGTWQPIYGGDGKFYEELAAIQIAERKPIVFLDKITYLIRHANLP
jgi:hypothetical protein